MDTCKEPTLPLILIPENGQLDAAQWVQANREKFEEDLANYGAILFRGFDIRKAEDFSRFMKCFNTEPLPYMFRSSPREELNKSIKNIYLSTSYPNDRSINMHNESSYSRVWGKKIIFCCITPAAQGGETPIADSRKVLQSINPELVDKFKAKGVKYRRNLIANIGMPWQEVFQTDDKAVVESTCRKNGIDYNFHHRGRRRSCPNHLIITLQVSITRYEYYTFHQSA